VNGKLYSKSLKIYKFHLGSMKQRCACNIHYKQVHILLCSNITYYLYMRIWLCICAIGDKLSNSVTFLCHSVCVCSVSYTYTTWDMYAKYVQTYEIIHANYAIYTYMHLLSQVSESNDVLMYFITLYKETGLRPH
jgi:hypothetical protein